MRMHVWMVAVVLAGSVWAVADEPTKRDRGSEASPAGRDGIAADYPGDNGIENDSSVVFSENFDTGSIGALAKRWESIQSKEILSLSSNVPADSGDVKSLLVTHVGGKGNGANLYRRLMPGHDKLHYRFYVKFDRDCAPIHHFFHVGGYNPATLWPQGGAGERPRGNERFTTGVEPFGNNWRWDYYSYWISNGGPTKNSISISCGYFATSPKHQTTTSAKSGSTISSSPTNTSGRCSPGGESSMIAPLQSQRMRAYVIVFIDFVVVCGGTHQAAAERFYFPPLGESIEQQERRSPSDVESRLGCVSGLLVAPGGQWKGKRLISRIQGHGGGNGSHGGGIGGAAFGSWGRVTSTFNQGQIPWKLFVGPASPKGKTKAQP